MSFAFLAAQLSPSLLDPIPEFDTPCSLRPRAQAPWSTVLCDPGLKPRGQLFFATQGSSPVVNCSLRPKAQAPWSTVLCDPGLKPRGQLYFSTPGKIPDLFSTPPGL
jgi:hypothetical protein